MSVMDGYCPLHNPKYDSANCDTDDCAWWDFEESACIMITIGRSLRKLSKLKTFQEENNNGKTGD